MKIYFGITLDDGVLPFPMQNEGNIQYLGPNRLLYTLESHLGLSGHPTDNEYLRIEQYRQGLKLLLEQGQDFFYARSFVADQFAVASELLSRRDELLLAGWSFEETKKMPSRLSVLSEVEKVMREKEGLELSLGFADRFIEVLKQLSVRPQPIREVWLNEPWELLPGQYQRLFNLLKAKGVKVEVMPEHFTVEKNDLGKFKTIVLNGQKEGQKAQLQGDGSLLVIKGERETDLAAYLAKMCSKNENFHPACLVPDKNRAIDNALVQEGLPSMGITSASLARPTLQVLKLVTAFLWRPIDPYKIMEFVSLGMKPLEEELANRIAEQIARTPGLLSDGWYAMINRYFEELKGRATKDASLKEDEIRFQYNFWFERQRYNIARTVPKQEVIDIFHYLERWALQQFEDTGGKTNSLQVLKEQAKRIRELLEALPENDLTHLELERIVRTIYEPAPVQVTEAECGHMPFVHKEGSVISNIPELLWWNFVSMEQDHFFSRWYQQERAYLNQYNVHLNGPRLDNDLLIWHRKRPVLHCGNRLILIMPNAIEGTKVHPHSLWGDLEAAFSNLEDISLDISNEAEAERFSRFFKLPQLVVIGPRMLGQPKPFLNINAISQLDRREEETVTSLNALFYYPYQWIFRHKIRLNKSSILSVVNDVTLMGNLSHRFFERLLRQDIQNWDKKTIESWIEEEARTLLSKEGAVLLMYGREPERINFIQKIKYAAWSLVSLIKDNGWRVLQTEQPLKGKFLDIPLNGRADLVLERGNEVAVLDLKWRGASRRQRMIKNEEDLQLVIYSRLLTEDHQWAHTAFFIMEQGKMIARNNLAFKNITAVDPEADHTEVNQRIMERMEATFRWRMKQIKSGKIEIRCEQTLDDLEDRYGGELIDLLEMKTENAPFDDYRTLINLIQ